MLPEPSSGGRFNIPVPVTGTTESEGLGATAPHFFPEQCWNNYFSEHLLWNFPEKHGKSCICTTSPSPQLEISLRRPCLTCLRRCRQDLEVCISRRQVSPLFSEDSWCRKMNRLCSYSIDKCCHICCGSSIALFTSLVSLSISLSYFHLIL